MQVKNADLDFDLVVTDVAGKNPGDGDQWKRLPGKKIVCRADTMTPLAWVSDKYQPVSHRQIIDATEAAIGSAPTKAFTTGRNAQIMYARWKKPEPHPIAPDDKIFLDLTIRHAISGNTSLQIEVGLFRLVCLNGMTVPFGENGEGKRSFRQFHNSGLNIDSFMPTIAGAYNSCEEILPLLRGMADFPIDNEAHLLTLRDHLAERNQLPKKLNDHMLAQVGKPHIRNAWNLLNEVSWYTTHRTRSLERKRAIDIAALDGIKQLMN